MGLRPGSGGVEETVVGECPDLAMVGLRDARHRLQWPGWGGTLTTLGQVRVNVGQLGGLGSSSLGA